MQTIQIPLTAQTGINIAKLTDGKDIPALCVNLFRVADFFLLKELQINVMKALRVHLDRLLVIPDNGDITSLPARMSEVNEVLESIKEAYKDNSTVHLREMLLGFLWMRNSRIFQIPKVALLLSEIPELGKDLMLTYISGDGTAHLHDTTKAPQGLLVYEAIREPAQIYKTGDKKASTKGGSKAICLLRHTPGRPSPFEVVDAKTGALIKELAWITPAICQISWIGSHETSEIVCIREKEDRHGYKKLWLRFETAGDARYYTGCHSGVDRQIQQNKCTKALLQTDMREAHDRVCGPDGT